MSEEGVGSLVSLLFSNIVRTGVKVMTMIVFVNEMLLMMAGDVERNPGPGKRHDGAEYIVMIVILKPSLVTFFVYLFADTLSLDNDLGTLQSELHEARDKWYNLGVQLKVPVSDLKAIQAKFKYSNDPGDCLREMLTRWLSITINPPPTWQRVVDALCSAPVDRPLIAEQIRNKYCSERSASRTFREFLEDNPGPGE